MVHVPRDLRVSDAAGAAQTILDRPVPHLKDAGQVVAGRGSEAHGDEPNSHLDG